MKSNRTRYPFHARNELDRIRDSEKRTNAHITRIRNRRRQPITLLNIAVYCAWFIAIVLMLKVVMA